LRGRSVSREINAPQPASHESPQSASHESPQSAMAMRHATLRLRTPPVSYKMFLPVPVIGIK
jgi:hypothetical protein